MFTSVALLTAFFALAPVTAVLGEPPSPAAAPAPRVRPYDSRSAALFLQGMGRSQTMRAIVDQLEQLDVIVYIEMQPSLPNSLAGRLTWLTRTAHHRFVRVSLSPTLAQDLLIATLAHELQHALEVAREPSIVDASSLSTYYQAHGIRTASRADAWDSMAARMVGEDVRRELAGMRTARVAESIQDFDPEDWHIVYRRARGMLPP